MGPPRTFLDGYGVHPGRVRDGVTAILSPMADERRSIREVSAFLDVTRQRVEAIACQGGAHFPAPGAGPPRRSSPVGRGRDRGMGAGPVVGALHVENARPPSRQHPDEHCPQVRVRIAVDRQLFRGRRGGPRAAFARTSSHPVPDGNYVIDSGIRSLMSTVIVTRVRRLPSSRTVTTQVPGSRPGASRMTRFPTPSTAGLPHHTSTSPSPGLALTRAAASDARLGSWGGH